jgi:WD40 repeat protein
MLVVCYSETCEEARRMIHGEWVTGMAVNKSGSLLVTAGIETFRVWELSSGDELYRIPKSRRALTMTICFGSVDTELVTGYDDCMVECYDIKRKKLLWSFLAEEEDDDDYHPCPRAMVLSPDVTKLAIVFRGRPVLIWDITTCGSANRPSRCVRASDRGKQASDAWDQLDTILWSPDGMSVFVLYQDATIMRFFLSDDEPVENGETSAREMVISHDGNLLLTSDNAGTLSLWTLPKFHLIYRLEYEEFVRDLAFSPDSQRFYDVRGAICNVWEPDVLIRPDEPDQEDVSTCDGSDTAVSDPVLSTDNTLRSQITSLAYGPFDEYYICGKDDGTVTIHEMSDGKKVRKVYHHTSSVAVIALAWSQTGKYVASCDDCGRVLTKRLEWKGEDNKWAVFPCLDLRADEPVRQFIFNPAEKLILMSTPTSDRIFNLKTKTEIWRRDRDQDFGLRWINHPSRKDLVLCIGPNHATIHEWSSQGKQNSTTQQEWAQQSGSSNQQLDSGPASQASPHLPSSPTQGQKAQNPFGRVRRLAMSDNRKFIIYEILPSIGPNTRFAGSELRLEVISSENVGDKDREFSPRFSRVYQNRLDASWVATKIISYFLTTSTGCVLGRWASHLRR